MHPYIFQRVIVELNSRHRQLFENFWIFYLTHFPRLWFFCDTLGEVDTCHICSSAVSSRCYMLKITKIYPDSLKLCNKYCYFFSGTRCRLPVFCCCSTMSGPHSIYYIYRPARLTWVWLDTPAYLPRYEHCWTFTLRHRMRAPQFGMRRFDTVFYLSANEHYRCS